MKIGVLQTGHINELLADKYPAYPVMFEQMLGPVDSSFTFAGYRVVDGEFPQHASECDAWVISGSRHGAYEDHDWIPPLEELIRQIVALNIPVIGVCFGHQIMAQALGGTVVKWPGGWGLGRQTYSWGEAESSEEVELYALHQDQVTVAPEGAEVIASNGFCEIAGLRYSPTAISVQPHPEFSADYMNDLIDVMEAAGRLSAADAARGRTAMTGPVDNAKFAQQFGSFIKSKSARAA